LIRKGIKKKGRAPTAYEKKRRGKGKGVQRNQRNEKEEFLSLL